MGNFLIILLCLELVGCASIGNHFREFPLYSEVWIEHPEYVYIFEGSNMDYFLNHLPDSDFTKTYLRIKARISDYINEHKNISSDISVALERLKIKRGMTKEQVILVVGKPTNKKMLKDNSELWIYKGDRHKIGEVTWYYDWGKLKFQNEVLADIEVKYIKIYK